MARRGELLAALLTLVLPADAAGQSALPPVRTDDNVIIASYNIKWLGQLQPDYAKLAQVIQHFDVCGIVEVKQETAVAELVDSLESLTSEDWGYLYGFRTNRPQSSYHEAYAVVWRKDRVEPAGLVSGIWDPNEVYRNDPYVASFRRGNFDFTIFLVHTRWSDDSFGSRWMEVATIVDQIKWYRTFLNERDFIVLGDFNYSGNSAAMQQMADGARLIQLDPNDKSTFKNDFSDYASSYDHIYVPEDTAVREFSGESETLDATELVYGDNSPANMALSKDELSDHLPVWAIFDVAGTDDD